MPVIPEYDAKESIDTNARGMPKVDYSIADVTAAGGFAKSIAGLGGIIGEIAQQRDKREMQLEDFTSQVNASRLQTQVAGEDQEAMQNMPENGAGWHDQRLANFDKKVPEFLAGVPTRLQPEYKQKLDLMRDQLSNQYAATEVGQRTKWADGFVTQQGEQAKQEAYANPDKMEQLRASLRETVMKSPLPERLKAEKLRQLEEGLEESAVRGRGKNDPAGAVRDLVPGGGRAGIGDGRINAVYPGSVDTPSAAGITPQGMYGYLISKGATKNEALMLTGAAANESGLNPAAVHDNGTGYGMFGHRLERLAAMRSSTGAQSPTWQQQAEFALKELRSRPEGKAVNAATTADEITAAQMAFERPQGFKEGSPNAGHNWNGRLATIQKFAPLTGQDIPAGGGSAADSPYQRIPLERRIALASDIQRGAAADTAAINADREKFVANQTNTLQTQIIDGTAGHAEVLKARQEGWLTDADTINKLTNAINTRDKAVGDVNAFNSALATPGFTWNHVDQQHKDMAEAGFKALGGGMDALQTVASKTGMVPTSAGVALRGAISSNDPTRVSNAMTVANNLMTSNPTIFTGVQGQNEIEQNAVSFKRYTENLGLTTQQAAQRIIAEQSPEYQASVRARVKNEDVDAIIKKQLDIGDLKSLFNEGIPLIGRPNVEFTPEARQGMFQDYAEVFRDFYMQKGDVGQAKELAKQQLSKLWGTTYINGKFGGNLMRYAPEKAPAYAGIPDVGARVAAQAQDAIAQETARLKGPYFGAANVPGRVEMGNINLNDRPIARNADGSVSTVRSMSFEDNGKEVLVPTVSPDGKILSDREAIALYDKTGQHLGKFNTPEQATAYAESLHKEQEKTYATAAIPRDKLTITPTSGGQTARAYWNGQPVPYALSWVDNKGQMQTLNPGRAFVPDPVAMRAAVSEERRAGLEAGQAALNPILDRSEQFRATKRQLREQAGARIRATREQVEGIPLANN